MKDKNRQAKSYSILVLLVYLFIFTIPSQVLGQCGNNWTWQNPSPQGNDLNDVFAFNSDTIVVVGKLSTIMKSIDGGNTWEIIECAASQNKDLISVQFSDPSTGWAVGDDGTILKSIDGGSTWFTQNSGTTEDLKSVHFINTQIGWGVGANGAIIKTTDGGYNWHSQISGTPVWLMSVHFIDSNTGWAVGNTGTILNTNDGGDNWHSSSLGTKELLTSVYFIDDSIGWVVGYDGIMGRSVNGGKSWSILNANITKNIKQIYFENDSTGWIASSYFYKTVDGGNTWIQIPDSNPRSIFGFHFINLDVGFGANWSGSIVKTTDGGSNWSEKGVQNISFDELESVYFTDPQNGWVVYGGGGATELYHTTNGGSTWNKKFHGTINGLVDIYFVNQQVGWAVGANGTIIQTIDGGNTWNSQESNTIGGLSAVQFYNTQIGWIGGLNEKFLTTYNGGKTWTHRNTGTTESIYSISFPSISKGWAVGKKGTIIHSDDTGKTWISQHSGTSDWLNSVFFIDELTGWAVGWNGTALKTSDGGTTWQKKDIGTSEFLDDIFFIDSLEGWIVGGTMLHTLDGGLTWQIEESGTKEYLKDIFFINKTKGWAVGRNGTILNTGNSPCTPTYSTITDSACQLYQSPGGKTIQTSGVYNDTIQNANGCDSIISINLEIIKIDTTINQSGYLLESNDTNGTYQWLQCEGTYSVINGAINKTYQTTSDGKYAVKIDKNGCSDTSECIPIFPDSISGVVSFQKSKMDHSRVLLYKKDSISFNPVDSTIIQPSDSGKFSFSSVNLGEYIVKSVPDSNSVYYSQSIPTYHDSTTFWDSATSIHPSYSGSLFIADIQMIESDSLTGNGIIGGTLYLEGSGKKDRLKLRQSDIEILILNKHNDPKYFNISNYAGEYIFEGLPLSTYRLLVEIPGYNSEFVEVALNSSNPVQSDIDFKVDTVKRKIYSINPNLVNYSSIESEIKVFPNPVKNRISINYISDREEPATISIYDQMGTKRIVKKKMFQLGTNYIEIDASNFLSGFYFLEINTSVASLIKKIIIL